MKIVSFDMVGTNTLPALARPGEVVNCYANNVEGELTGVLIDAFEIEQNRVRVRLVIEDGDLWRLSDTDLEYDE